MMIKCRYNISDGVISTVELILGTVTTPSGNGVLYANASVIPGQNLGDFVSNPQHYRISGNTISLVNGFAQTGERGIASPNTSVPLAMSRVNTISSFATL